MFVCVNCNLHDLKGLDFNFQDCWRHCSLQEHTRISQSTDAEELCQKQMEGEHIRLYLSQVSNITKHTRYSPSFLKSKRSSGCASWDLPLVSLLSVYTLSSQQAFNATAVIRHMRRLQLGTSFGSNIHNSNSVSGPQSRAPAKSQSVDCTPLSLKDCEWHFRCSL